MNDYKTPDLINRDGNEISLRDWFAGMALQGIASNPSFDCITPPEYASDAYSFADAMLAARAGKEGA
jgi:hypothetical protein